MKGSKPIADRTVTFRADPDGYGVVECSWEDEARGERITLAARKFAEGWKAKFNIEEEPA